MEDDDKRLSAVEQTRSFEICRRIKEGEKKKIVEDLLNSVLAKVTEADDIHTKSLQTFESLKTFQTDSAKFYKGLTLNDEKRGISNGAPAIQEYWKKVATEYENNESLLENCYQKLKKQSKQLNDLRKELTTQKTKILKQFGENQSKLEKLYVNFEKAASHPSTTDDVWLQATLYHATVVKIQEVQLVCWQTTVALVSKAEKLNEERALTLRAIFREYLLSQNAHLFNLLKQTERSIESMNEGLTITKEEVKPAQQVTDQLKTYEEVFSVKDNTIEFPFANEKKKDEEIMKEGGLLIKSFSKKRIVVTKSGFVHIFDMDKSEPGKTLHLNNYYVEKGQSSWFYLSSVDSKERIKFQCDSANNMEQWIEFLQKRKAKLSNRGSRNRNSTTSSPITNPSLNPGS